MNQPATRSAAGRALRNAALLILMGAAAVLLLAPFDQPALQRFGAPAAEREDLHRLLRVMGFLPTWLFVAAIFICHDWPERRVRPAGRRGLFLLVCVLASGLAAEAIKLIVRRERPSLEQSSAWTFRPYSVEPLSTSGLSLPSSHAMVAFAACWALCLLVPRARPVWFLLAAGCAVTRLLDRAHFLTDLVASAFLAAAVVAALRPLLRDEPAPMPGRPA